MPSIGAKRLVCPSGEQVVNGGFETGDFTGWNHDIGGYALIRDFNVHSGSYCCELEGFGFISQDLSNEIPQQCFVGSSVFGYYYSLDKPSYGTLTHKWRVTLTYTDDSTTIVDYDETTSGDGNYTPYSFADLKAYVEAGKTLKTIKIERLTSQGGIFIDDVTCDV
jgi:hypothetical protein